MSTESNEIFTEEKKEDEKPVQAEVELTTLSEAESTENEAILAGNIGSDSESNDESKDTNEQLINEILSNQQLRQNLENRIFSSCNQEMKSYIQLRHEAERRRDNWMSILETVDPLTEPERRAMVKMKIDLAIEDIGKYEGTIHRLQCEVGTRVSLKPTKMNTIRQRMEEVYDRDVIFAILVAMFPQMEWTTLQSIFLEVINRIGEDVIPTIANQKIARTQQQTSEKSHSATVAVKSSLIDNKLSATLRRIRADIHRREVAGEEVEVISFNKEDLPEIEGFIREEYRDIILFYVIPALVNLVCEEDLKWGVRQLIGYAIGDFMQQATSRIYDLLTAAWAISDNASTRATTGYLLSRAVEKALQRESLFSYLKEWINSGDARLQWTAASACKEIGKVDIKLALDGLQQVLKGQQQLHDEMDKESVLNAIAYSLVVLGLSGFYREVLTSLSQWIVQETNKDLRKIQVLFFLRIIDAFLRIVQKELQYNERDEIGNQDSLESKCIEALWRIFTQKMEDEVQKAIVNVLVTVVRSPSDLFDVLFSQINVDLLGRWLDIFSKKTDRRTYEPEVQEIVENLLMEVYSKLESSEASLIHSSVSDVQQLSRRERRLTNNPSRRNQSSEYQDVFWLLIKPWQEEAQGNIKREVFIRISQRIGKKGRRAHRNSFIHSHRH